MNFNVLMGRIGAVRMMGLAALAVGLVNPAAAADAAVAIPPSDLRATLLLVAGIFLLLLEIKIVSQGILAFVGSAMLLGAAVMIWQEGRPFWGIPVGWIIPAIGAMILLTALLSWLAYQAQKEKVSTGYDGYVGEIAEVRQVIDGEGQVYFNGSYWKALSPVRIEVGQKVRVVAADRLKLIVEPLTATPITASGRTDDGMA